MMVFVRFAKEYQELKVKFWQEKGRKYFRLSKRDRDIRIREGGREKETTRHSKNRGG